MVLKSIRLHIVTKPVQGFRRLFFSHPSRARAPRTPATTPQGPRLHNAKGAMTFSLTENLPFLALPLTLIALKVMYDLLHPVAFFALVAAGIGAYMFYAGNKSPAAQRTAKRAEATADSLIQELTQEEDRAKEDAARKQAAKDKKAAAKQQQEAARKAAQAAKAAAAAAALAAAQEAENKARSAPPSKSKKQPKQPKKQQPKAPESEEESDDDADEILLRMAQLERQRRSQPGRK